MALPPPPPGWTRYKVKRSFWWPSTFRILDLTTKEVLFRCHSRMMSRPEISDGAGRLLYRIDRPKRNQAHGLSIIDSLGRATATLIVARKHNDITMDIPNKPKWEMWAYPGLEKGYRFDAGGRPVMEIHYSQGLNKGHLDVVDLADRGLALVILWTVFRWYEYPSE